MRKLNIERSENIFEYLFYLLFYALIIVCIIRTMKVGTDYRVFYFAGKRIISGDYDLYNIIRDGILTYKYSPFFAVLFVPLSTISYKLSLFFWAIINSAFFILGWLSCENFLKKNNINISNTHRLLTLLFMIEVVTLNAQQANINAVVFGMVMFGLYTTLYAKKTLIQNIGLFLIALISSIKLTPMALVLFFLVIKEYRKCFLLIMMFTALMIIPVFFFGLSKYPDLIKRWILVLSDTGHFPFYKYTNQSTIAQLSRWFGGNTLTVKFISSCINTFVLLCVLYSSRFKNVILSVSLTIIFMLCVSPVSWKEYQIILCLPLMFMNIKLINRELKGFPFYLYLARILIVNILVQAIIGEKLGLMANYHGNYLWGILLLCTSMILYFNDSLNTEGKGLKRS